MSVSAHPKDPQPSKFHVLPFIQSLQISLPTFLKTRFHVRPQTYLFNIDRGCIGRRWESIIHWTPFNPQRCICWIWSLRHFFLFYFQFLLIYPEKKPSCSVSLKKPFLLSITETRSWFCRVWAVGAIIVRIVVEFQAPIIGIQTSYPLQDGAHTD